jgi:hypothetical protein
VSKRKIEESLREFFRLHGQLTQNKIKIDLECCNHFQEIRCKIDKHRDELKEKIDEISLQMIDQVQSVRETIYDDKWRFDNKNNLFTIVRSFEEMQDLSEKLRDPNILIDDIRQIEQKQEAHVAVLKTQTRRNEQNQRSFAIKSI